ncbi:hypothetical protein KPH14_007588 [Odynerus spinipes]|uniref:Uncharacterized protein n=1 Tax=Odynerus spinipes TaxID=1348599 RepID=A0AAD9RIK8_9HYME|nr:hypothetical protein KPH14_007588 [Odynerus spinipes]
MTFKASFGRFLSRSLTLSLWHSFFSRLLLQPTNPLFPSRYRLKHGACSCSPLKYTHVDIAGHLPQPHHVPYSGNPVVALSYCYLIQGKCLTVRNDLPFEMQYVCEVDCKPVCIPPCQPCTVPCEPAPCVPCATCPTDPCCQPACQPCTPCAPCAPCQPCQPCQPCAPCPEAVTVLEPMCQPNIQRRGLNTCCS